MLQHHVRIFLAGPGHHFAPENAVLEHVGLVNARQLFPPQAGGLERHVRNALNFRRGVNHGVNRPEAARHTWHRLGLFWLAEVHAARQFPHHQNINAIALALYRQGTRMGKRLGQLHRAQVGEQAEFLANAQQGRALGPLLLGNCRIPLGQAHRSE